jgi:hypothetical protein
VALEQKAFDWSDDAGIVVRAYGSIAVYQNKNRDVVIRQEDSTYGRGEDSIVFIPAPQALIVAKAIISALKKTRA